MQALKISDNARARLALSAVVLFTLLSGAVAVSFVAQAQPQALSSIGDKTVDQGQNNTCDDAFIAELPQPRYIGLWRAGSGEESWQTFSTWTSLVTAHQGMGPAMLVDLETYAEGGSRSYAAVWRMQGATSDELTSEADLTALEASRVAKEQAGLGLTEVEIVPQQGAPQALAVWRPGAPTVELLEADNAAAFEAGAAAKAPTHFLIDLEVWREAGEARFLGVFRPRTGGDGEQIIKLAQTWCTFHDDYHALIGYRLEDLELDIDAQGNRLYSAFWSAGNVTDHLWIGYGREGEHGFDQAGQDLAGQAPSLLLADLEILDEPIPDLQPDGRQQRLSSRRTVDSLRRSEQEAVGTGGADDFADDFKVEDDPVINGAPVLHDTGSSGPD